MYQVLLRVGLYNICTFCKHLLAKDYRRTTQLLFCKFVVAYSGVARAAWVTWIPSSRSGIACNLRLLRNGGSVSVCPRAKSHTIWVNVLSMVSKTGRVRNLHVGEGAELIYIASIYSLSSSLSLYSTLGHIQSY